MVEYEYVIYQRVNYVLNRLHFREYNQSTRTNNDNNNNYDYDQALGKQYAWQRQYIIPGTKVRA